MRRKKAPVVLDPILPFKYSPRVTLYPGDIFRCSSGPYYVTNDGDHLAMGERGMFCYVNIAKDGILARPYDPKNAFPKAMVFIYMGEDTISEITGTHFRSHKIRKVRKKT